MTKYQKDIDDKNDAIGVMYVENFDTDDFWNTFYVAPTHPIDDIVLKTVDNTVSLTDMNQKNILEHNDEFVTKFVKFSVDSRAFDKVADKYLQYTNNATVDKAMDSLRDL